MSQDHDGCIAGSEAPLLLTSASGLSIKASTRSDDGVLHAFYESYDKAFVLENEKEGFRGFEDCLALNAGDSYLRLLAQFGPFREFVLVATDPDNGRQIGGANFVCFPLTLAERSPEQVFSLNLNYVFVNQDMRRQGYFARLVEDMPDLALQAFSKTNAADVPERWLSAPPSTFMFVEQNDPYKMSPRDYDRDTEYTGLDQMARIAMWARRGAKLIDFDYVQPALTESQEADRTLVYGLIAPNGKTLSSCLLKEHLRRFFGISVLKGKDPAADPVAATQLEALDRLCGYRQRIGLLSIDVEKIRSPTERGAAARSMSIREALRQTPSQ